VGHLGKDKHLSLELFGGHHAFGSWEKNPKPIRSPLSQVTEIERLIEIFRQTYCDDCRAALAKIGRPASSMPENSRRGKSGQCRGRSQLTRVFTVVRLCGMGIDNHVEHRFQFDPHAQVGIVQRLPVKEDPMSSFRLPELNFITRRDLNAKRVFLTPAGVTVLMDPMRPPRRDNVPLLGQRNRNKRHNY
jgi:hypothetical protein